MRNYFISTILLFFCCIYFISCDNDPYKLDVSQSEIKLKVQRFDLDLKEVSKSNLSSARQTLYQKYGAFYNIYMEEIIRIGSGQDTNTLKLTEKFYADSMISAIQSSIENLYSTDEQQKLENRLEGAFTRYKALFPEKNIPDIILANTGFNVGIAILENQISIGLDFYLGKDNELLQYLPIEQFPKFKKNKMERRFLEIDAVKYWIESELFQDLNKGELLDQIIKQGKLMYLLDILYYKENDADLMSYSQEEYAWVIENQENIWQIIGNQKILFGTRTFDNQKWINDGPFTNVQGIPDSSPARLGVWVGWQMVNDYMVDHPEIDLVTLLQEQDSQKIMRSYDPRN